MLMSDRLIFKLHLLVREQAVQMQFMNTGMVLNIYEISQHLKSDSCHLRGVGQQKRLAIATYDGLDN